MKRTRVVLYLTVGIFLVSCLSLNVGVSKHTQANLLQTSTFVELGYKTTRTLYNGDSVTLYVNCSGASMNLYSARINLHFTGEDSYYVYRMNMGPEISGGAHPGCEFYSGWQERWIEPGFFREGNNSLLIRVSNCPLSDQTSSIYKYLIILPDSYIEIYDGSMFQTVTESLTTITMESSEETSETFTSPPNGFIAGLVIGALVTGGALTGWYLYFMRNNRVKSYAMPSKQFIVRTPTEFVCSICKQKIMSDQLTECPNCHNAFHESHFAEAIKTTGKCPLCKNDIITLDRDGDTQYTTWSQQEK